MSDQEKSLLAYKRIRKIAGYARVFSILGIAIYILSMGYYSVTMLVDPQMIDTVLRDEYAAEGRLITINGVSRSIAFVFEIILLMMGVYICLQATKLFNQYQDGRVFKFEAAARLNKMGWAIVLLAPLGALLQTLSVLVLTAYNPPGQKQLSIMISEAEIYSVILGLLLVILAKILHEAAIISEENQAFI